MGARSLLNYRNLADHIQYNPREIDVGEAGVLMEQFTGMPQLFVPFKGVTHVINYAEWKHVCVGGDFKHMLGYSPESILQNGLGFIIDIFQKDDFEIYNGKIFPIISDFLKKTPHSRHSDFIFSFTYRTTRSDGKLVQVYQQSCYITCPKTHLPLYGIGLVSDISPLKSDNAMLFTIDEKTMEDDIFQYKNIYTAHFYPDPAESDLSKREKEVLARMAQGLSSKQIADKLYISENTILNHRKAILRKTNTKNVAELIAHAIRSNII
jgi:DNA-binding CsgD family transcriptional regulator